MASQDAGREAAGQEPFLRIVKGDLSQAELTALVATLAAIAAARRGAANRTGPRPVPAHWNARARLMRTPVHPAPDGWRRSALP